MTANPVAAAIALTRFLLEELDAIALSTARRLDALEDGVRQDPMGFQAVVSWPWMTVEPPECAGGGLDYPAAEARMVKKPERIFVAGVIPPALFQARACIGSTPSRILNGS